MTMKQPHRTKRECHVRFSSKISVIVGCVTYSSIAFLPIYVVSRYFPIFLHFEGTVIFVFFVVWVGGNTQGDGECMLYCRIVFSDIDSFRVEMSDLLLFCF